MTDEELTDAWEAGTQFSGGIAHLQHLRIAWVLHRRHGADRARARLLEGTKRACEAAGCPEKFDAALTERWANTIARAIHQDRPHGSADEFLAAHADLRRGDLLGKPNQQPAHGS